jgi:hypothetical protein
MLQLICEGRCNPNIAEVDAAIRKFAEARNKQLAFDGTERMLALQRRLTYTDHYMDEDAQAICDVCGARRQFGWRRGFYHTVLP